MSPSAKEKESRLLEELRYRFPIVERPFEEIGDRVGLTESETLEMTEELQRKGTIRRMGYMAGKAVRKGRTSTLIGLKVAPERVESSAIIINRSNNVTHDYLRDHEFNLWFTLGGPDRDSLESELARIIDEVGPLDWIELPSVRTFKLNSPSGSA
jgi:DNA-binding Lrp family transcriptional regulator